MNQLLAVWETLSNSKRIAVVAATVIMFGAVLGLTKLSSQAGMALLYSGLDAEAAGEIVQSLDQQNVTYEIKGGAIYVDAGQRDALRLTLAAEGLPRNAAQGYELLDGLSGFATTSQMFDAAYWRAKEGELARTILSNASVRSARVHISTQAGTKFRRDIAPSAAVSIATSGGSISKEYAQALKFLVASAVSGLTPDNVAIIDSGTGVVVGSDDTRGITDANDRADQLKHNVERLLEARVGPGKAIVEVSVEVGKDTESVVERRLDPNSRVVISTDTEERANSANDSGDAGVTVASNLPTGNAAAGGAQTNSQTTETRERVNFEVSETTREILKAPGTVQRVSVAVLIDGITTTDAAGVTTWAPRSEEELVSLKELVSTAIGYNVDRNDSVTIKSMQFEPLAELGTEVTSASLGTPLNIGLLAQMAALAVVSLVLGLFVVRPILLAKPAIASLPAPTPGSLAEIGLPANVRSADQLALGSPVLTGTVEGPTDLPALNNEARAASIAGLTENGEIQETDPVKRLRNLIADRRVETVEILRSWMEESEVNSR